MTVQLPYMLCTCATSGGLKPRVTREIQPRVPASLHSLEHFFTLSHTLPLHDSHLNTGFLSAVLQANMSRNKANTWLIKFNLTTVGVEPILDAYDEGGFKKAPNREAYLESFKLVGPKTIAELISKFKDSASPITVLRMFFASMGF